MKPLFRLLALQALLVLLVTSCTTDSPFQPNQQSGAIPSGSFGSVVTLPIQIGDQVIDDINQNGVIDDGEPGIAGVIVRLYACDATLIAEDTSDANGVFGFVGLDNGNYYVSFSTPTGYVFSGKDVGGDDAVDSDADPVSGKTDCIAYDTSLFLANVDACLHQSGPIMPAFLGNQVWHDVNANGRQDGEPGIAGVLVRLRNCSGDVLDSIFTNSLGQYTFPFLNPGVYSVQFVPPTGFDFVPFHAVNDVMMDSDADPSNGITPCIILRSGGRNFDIDAGLVVRSEPDPLCVVGDRVWNDVNMDGIQDAGEDGLPGVSVELLDCNGNLLASMMSDASGAYQFSDLDAGNYSLRFSAPDGILASPQDVGSDDGFDSDADPTYGSVVCFSLAAGDTVEHMDAGFYLEPPPIQRGSIGDFVWEDANGDGVQDPDEFGMPEVVVNLYACDDSPLASVRTDGAGFYLFDSLLPGNYIVEFVAPVGYQFSPQNKADNGEFDSDANAGTGRTVCFTLVEGARERSIDAGLQVKSMGCTRPRAYWKYHTGQWQWSDEVSQYLPIWLGNEGGGRSIKVETAEEARQILSGHIFGRSYFIHSALYAELLTAKLNVANGADPSEVADAIAQADNYLMDDDWRAWRHNGKGWHSPVYDWVGTLFLYNWGIIGPGNCDLPFVRPGKDWKKSANLSSQYDRDEFDDYVDQVIEDSGYGDKMQ